MVDSVSECGQGVIGDDAVEAGARRPDIVEGHDSGADQKGSTA